MTFDELVTANRSYRRFDESHAIDRQTLVELVDLTRRVASSSNRQPLRYILACTPDDNARVFLTNCICLLPGSLAADLQGDRIDIHLLDAAQQPEAELHRLEKAVGRLFVTAPDHPGKSAPC